MKKLASKLIAYIIVLGLVISYLPNRSAFADRDPNVKYYEIDGEWVGFNAVTQTLTWYPDNKSEITIPDSFDGVTVKKIGEWAICKHENLVSVTIPDTVEELEEGVFYGCTKLKTVKGLKNVKIIGDNVFGKCTNLTTVEGLGSVTTIGEYAFLNCESLTNLDGFKSLSTIKTRAFVGCKNLKSISSIDSVQVIEDDSFSECEKLKSLIIPAATRTDILESNNVSKHIYSDAVMDRYKMYCAQNVTSYLYWDGTNYWRVEKSGATVIEKYTKDFKLVEAFTLETDLNRVWGGFFSGKNYNFIITGSENENDSDSKVVIFIDKYSKDWEKLDTATIKGSNTHMPFQAGSLRCAEAGGYLYIHACGTRYRADDGYTHQGNFTIEINEKKMKVVDFYSSFGARSAGGVSHSFNQFILIDSDKNIITLDHGDASPRTIALFKNGIKAGEKNYYSTSGKMISLYDIPAYKGDAEFGYNRTGTSLGGLEETKSGYVTAYVTDGKGGNADYDAVKNVYITFTPKSDFSAESTKTIKITSYSENGTKSAGTPQMVSIGKSGGYIIWDIIENGKVSGKIGYVKYNAKGEISTVKTASGNLSDCKPIYANKKVIWYTTINSKPVVYTLTKKGVTKKSL
ncbi:MAG: leucine-rich repeat domain-containing protein [Lachnospiraceae bacterium]|nr:leucine-rich repeat domain-containing protein [Lachnospiraceae bacterium]